MLLFSLNNSSIICLKQNFTVFPKKLGTEPLSGQKLTKLIYDKNSIVEILESIIEEKNRKIFYGNPV
jgi:hypothetical protein